MINFQTAEKALKSFYLSVIAELIDTEYVRKYGRE